MEELENRRVGQENGIFLMLLIATIIMLSSCTRYDGTSTRILDDLGIQHEYVNDMPNGAHAYADYHTKKVYVKRGKQQVALLLHESVHMLRLDAEVTTTPRLEEIIACKAAYEIGRIGGIATKINKFTLPGWINDCLAANGMAPRRLTLEERNIIEVEVARSVQLVQDRLNESGKSMTDVDWVKTGILILL